MDRAVRLPGLRALDRNFDRLPESLRWLVERVVHDPDGGGAEAGASHPSCAPGSRLRSATTSPSSSGSPGESSPGSRAEVPERSGAGRVERRGQRCPTVTEHRDHRARRAPARSATRAGGAGAERAWLESSPQAGSSSHDSGHKRSPRFADPSSRSPTTSARWPLEPEHHLAGGSDRERLDPGGQRFPRPRGRRPVASGDVVAAAAMETDRRQDEDRKRSLADVAIEPLPRGTRYRRSAGR